MFSVMVYHLGILKKEGTDMKPKFYEFGGIIVMEIQVAEHLYEYYVRSTNDMIHNAFEFSFGVEEPFTEAALKALHKVNYFGLRKLI